jgi:hypothetical protein
MEFLYHANNSDRSAIKVYCEVADQVEAPQAEL